MKPSKRPFSVPIGEAGSDRCCEWRWPNGEAVWNLSSKEGVRTCLDGPLTEEGREALVAFFGLTAWLDQFPLDRIRTMPPCELYAFVRKSTNTKGLSIPRSDRMGDRIPATLAA